MFWLNARAVALLALWLLVAAACAPRDPSSLTRPPTGWVIDELGVLSTDTVSDINRIGDAVHREDGAELMVVVVAQTHGMEPRALATTLFNRFELGRSQRDNGVLLFVALRDGAVEIVLGDGIDDPERLALSQAVMNAHILPHFRAELPALAIAQGAYHIASDLLDVVAPLPRTPVEAQLDRWKGWLLWGLSVLAVPLIVLVLRRRKTRAPFCGGCARRMTPSSGGLTPLQSAEVRAGSARYDEWACAACGTHEAERHPLDQQDVGLCDHCHAYAVVRSGQCLHCGQVTLYPAILPEVPVGERLGELLPESTLSEAQRERRDRERFDSSSGSAGDGQSTRSAPTVSGPSGGSPEPCGGSSGPRGGSSSGGGASGRF